MQIIRAISISNGQPVIYMPLGVILAITAIKDFFEDQKRHKSDNEENKRKVSVIRNGDLIETFWADVLVGEIIKVIFILVKLAKSLIEFRSMKMNFYLQMFF